MSQELHYTSVPRGLKPGSRGFCTVAATAGASGPLLERLESLSAYQPVYPVHDPAAPRNPVNFMHLKPTIGGKSFSILSRVGPAGLDYSGRTNKYAHHIVLDANERPSGGPAWLLSQPGFLLDAWQGEPRVLAVGTRPPSGDHPPGVAHAWHALTGDAGWAGVLAEAFLSDPRRTAIVIFRPGMNLLPLFVEAIALLPPSRRWDVEFSTFFSTLPPGVTCSWRGVIDGSPEAEASLRLPGALVINLCHLDGRAEGRALVHQARTGRAPETAGADAEPSSVQPPGRRATPTPARHEPPPSRAPAAAAYEVIPPVGPPATPARPPSAPKARRKSQKSSPAWAIVTAIAAACLVMVAAAAYFLLPPRDGNRQASVEPEQPTHNPDIASKVQEKLAAKSEEKQTPLPHEVPALPSPPKLANEAQPVKSPETKTKAPAPTLAATPKNDPGPVPKESQSKVAAVGPIPSSDPAKSTSPADLPPSKDSSNDVKPAVNRDVLLALEMNDPAKDTPGPSVLELDSHMTEAESITKLDLASFQKTAKAAAKSPHAANSPSDPRTLDIMTDVPADIGRKEQVLAHFKIDGRKIRFNWDETAKGRDSSEAVDLLRDGMLKITTSKPATLYALFKPRPRDRMAPLGIREDAVTRIRAARGGNIKVDVVWDNSDKHQFLYLHGNLLILKMKAQSKNSKNPLVLVETDKPGKWVCKVTPDHITMTAEIRESDNKLGFTFTSNLKLLETRLTGMTKSSRSLGLDVPDLTAEDAGPKSNSNQRDRERLEDEIRLIHDLIDAEYSFVIGLKVEDNKVLEFVRIGTFAKEKTQ